MVTLKAMEATPLTFKDYGQVIEASPDGQEFGLHDAQLDLTHGTPRFHLSINLQFLGFFSHTFASCQFQLYCYGIEF